MNSFEVIKNRSDEKRSPLFSLSEISFVIAREILENEKAISFVERMLDESEELKPEEIPYSRSLMPVGGEYTREIANEVLALLCLIIRDQNEIALNSLLRYFVPELFRLIRNNRKTIDEEFVLRFLKREEEDESFADLDDYSVWQEGNFGIAIYLYVLFCSEDGVFYRTEQGILGDLTQTQSGYASIMTCIKPRLIVNGTYDPAGIRNMTVPLNLLVFSERLRKKEEITDEEFVREAVSAIHEPGAAFLGAPNQFGKYLAAAFSNQMIDVLCKEVENFCLDPKRMEKDPSVGVGLEASVYQVFSAILPSDFFSIDLRSLYLEHVSEFVKNEESLFYALFRKCYNSDYAWLLRMFRAMEQAGGQQWKIDPDNFSKNLVLGVQTEGKAVMVPDSGDFLATILIRHILSETVLALSYRKVYDRLIEETDYDPEEEIEEKDQEIERLKKALEEQTKRAERAEKALEEAERNRKQTEKEIYALRKENESLNKKVEELETADTSEEAEEEDEFLPATEGVELSFTEGKRTDQALLYLPDMPELFGGEIREHILKALAKSVGEDASRHRDILRAVLAVNPGTGELRRRAEIVRTVLTGYRHLTKTDFAKLETVGVTMKRQDGAHYILTLEGNEQYSVATPKTPSSTRSGANIAARIKATMF